MKQILKGSNPIVDSKTQRKENNRLQMPSQFDQPMNSNHSINSDSKEDGNEAKRTFKKMKKDYINYLHKDINFKPVE